MELYFYRLHESDLEFLNTIRNQYAADFLHDSRTFSIEETKEWFNKTSPLYYIIKDERSNKIGYFRLSNYSKQNKNMYIGADIAPGYKGKGYAKPAYKRFMDLLFNYYDLNKISLEVLSTNTVAINLYTSLGFVHEGIKRQEVLKNGEWVDSIIMSTLKSEFYEDWN